MREHVLALSPLSSPAGSVIVDAAPVPLPRSPPPQTARPATDWTAVSVIKQYLHTLILPQGSQMCMAEHGQCFLLEPTAESAAYEYGVSERVQHYVCTRKLRVLDARGTSYSNDEPRALGSTYHWARWKTSRLTSLDAACLGRGGPLSLHIMNRGGPLAVEWLPPLSVLPCALEMLSHRMQSPIDEQALLHLLAHAGSDVDAVLAHGYGPFNLVLFMNPVRAVQCTQSTLADFVYSASNVRSFDSAVLSQPIELCTRVARMLDGPALFERKAVLSSMPGEAENDSFVELIYNAMTVRPHADTDAVRAWDDCDRCYWGIEDCECGADANGELPLPRAHTHCVCCSPHASGVLCTDCDSSASASSSSSSSSSASTSTTTSSQSSDSSVSSSSSAAPQQQPLNIIGQWLRTYRDDF